MMEPVVGAVLAEIGKKLDPSKDDFSGDIAIVSEQADGTWLFEAGWGANKICRVCPSLEQTPDAGLKIVFPACDGEPFRIP